jgi:CelD/BcsL family acetyltransferase involved in cellulose biosynthesis
VTTSTARAPLTLESVSTPESFAALAPEWDDLVRAMPRPTPFLLHAWLVEWWRHYGEEDELAVQVARRDGRLVAALPLCLLRRGGLKVLTFVGSQESVLADVLLAPGEGRAAAEALAGRMAESRHDLVDIYGLPRTNELLQAMGTDRLHFIERAESPVLDLYDTWDVVYRDRTSSKARSLHRRRRRQLGELGHVETKLARTEDALLVALEDAFMLHDLRWEGRPDGSHFTTETGKRFHRAAIHGLAQADVARIITLKVDGRPVAFNYFFNFERRMYGHRLAFDPAYSRVSPGLINTLDAIAWAAEEGATRIEFLGGPERYKIDLADRFEPVYEAIGLARTVRGRAAVAGRVGAIRTRRFLKRSPALRKFYFEGLAPARRLLARPRKRRGPPAPEAG